MYMDREIVMEAAKTLGVSYEEIAEFDEKNASFWKSVLCSFQYGDYTFSPAEYVPSDQEIHKIESEVILGIASQQSAIIVGRGANFVLKDEPNHVSIFVHAAEPFRVKRIQQMFGVSSNEALNMIHKTDQSRENYIHKFTGHNLYDLRHYNLVIDTGLVDLEKAEELVLDYLKLRFGESTITSLLNKKDYCNE